MENQTNSCFYFYRIAELNIRIFDPLNVDLGMCLPSFEAFRVNKMDSGTFLLEIELSETPLDIVMEDTELLSDVSYIMDERFRFEKNQCNYFTRILGAGEHKTWVMRSSKDFVHSIIFPQMEELRTTSKLSWLIMIAFGQACLSQQTILIHSSVVLCQNLGFAFLGKSGTGKSTHSRLWLQHIQGTEFLNDDNPAIRIFDNGEIYVYGTPWSGKTHCYRNIKVPLAGITRLQQGPKNEFQWKTGKEALIAILPSGSGIRWDHRIYSQLLDVLELLIKGLPIGHLVNLPNREAAELHLEMMKSILSFPERNSEC